jgi:hypothetical protein
MKLLIRTHGRNKAVVCTSFLHRCATILCLFVCVCSFSARWRRSAPSLSVLIQFEEVTKKGFTDWKRPWTLESVSNTTREATDCNPRETWSDLYYRLLSAVTRSENLPPTPCRSSMLFKRVPRICWEISSWPEWISTYHHDHQGWMVSGQETIFCWVQPFPFQFLIP